MTRTDIGLGSNVMAGLTSSVEVHGLFVAVYNEIVEMEDSEKDGLLSPNKDFTIGWYRNEVIARSNSPCYTEDMDFVYALYVTTGFLEVDLHQYVELFRTIINNAIDTDINQAREWLEQMHAFYLLAFGNLFPTWVSFLFVQLSFVEVCRSTCTGFRSAVQVLWRFRWFGSLLEGH